MATNPAHVTAAVTSSKPKHRGGRAQRMAEFLSAAPSLLTRKELEDGLAGLEGFGTKKAMNNAVIYAQKLGHLSSQNSQGQMKNSLSGKRAISGTATKKKALRTNGSSHSPDGYSGMDGALRMLDAADDLAAKALLDPESVSVTDLARHVTSLTSVFHAVLDQ